MAPASGCTTATDLESRPTDETGSRMSIASVQAQKFYQQVTSERRVYTVTQDGEMLIFRAPDKRIMPFWSSRTRVERIQRLHPKYRAYECHEMTLESFLDVTLSHLEAEGVHVGINWSGPRLVGHDLPAADLRKNLEDCPAQVNARGA